MPGKSQAQEHHSSAAAFEVRHQTGGSGERARAAQRFDVAQGRERAASGGPVQQGAEGGFTRRCGKRAPGDKMPCMYPFGHDGRHAWEPDGAASGSAATRAPGNER